MNFNLKIDWNEVHLNATGSVPWIATAGPGQLAGERRYEVMQRPGDDDIVEEIHVKGNQNDSESDSCLLSLFIRLTSNCFLQLFILGWKLSPVAFHNVS